MRRAKTGQRLLRAHSKSATVSGACRSKLKLLRHIADARPRQVPALPVGEGDFTLVAPFAENGPQQCALAAAVRSDHGDNFAAGQAEGDIVDNQLAAAADRSPGPDAADARDELNRPDGCFRIMLAQTDSSFGSGLLPVTCN